MKLLKERYKTWEGAHKRCGFENGVAESEYRHGFKTKVYRYSVVIEGNTYRVQRDKGTRPDIARAPTLLLHS